MGMVYGFMLLDERDGGLITLIAVTPTGKAGYLEMRLGIPVLLSLAFILFYLFLLQLELELTLIQILFISPLVASQSLIGVLFLAAFADNKVMGMALAKGLGILLIAPLLDYFLPSPLNWAGVYSPLFWSSRALLSSGGSVFWLYALITMLSQGILIWILFRKFRTRSD